MNEYDEDIEIVSDQLENGKYGQNRYQHRNGYSSEDDEDDDGNSLITNKKNMKTASSVLFGRKDKLTINDVEMYPLPSAHHERKMKAQGLKISSRQDDEEAQEPKIQDDIAKWSVLKDKYHSYNLYMMILPTACGLTGLSGFGMAIYLMTSIPEDENAHRNLIAISILLLTSCVACLFTSINVWRKRGLIKLMYETKIGYLGPAAIEDVFGWTLQDEAFDHFLQIRYGPDNIKSSIPMKKNTNREAHFFFCGEGVYLDGQIEPFDGMTRLKDVSILKIKVGQRHYKALHISLNSLSLFKTRIWIIIPDAFPISVLKRLYTRLLSSCSSPELMTNSGQFSILEEETDKKIPLSNSSSRDGLLSV
eukprot:TRINITY_DN695_c0_g4_i1.p1 TRINITY_DN695_c0_g4~~TRINITY_DN695_c0_g4_i1.p1  ORF type:complete len:363 (+),score=53.20 TRINITY_DN695_c0_g4_i1:285-1373(+)